MPQAALVERLVARRIPVTPVNSIDDMLADPHVRARGSLVHVADEALGDLALVAPAPRLSETPGRIGDVNPSLGMDADMALKRWTGG